MFKRGLDVTVSAMVLVVVSPLLLIVAILIRISSPGPIFYRAKRIGKAGRPFLLYKFRSMLMDADKIGPGITIAQDMRVTRVGRFLRSSKLDEFPQFFNVLLGDMSLVGPRPEDPRYVALYTPEQCHVLDTRPGITSPASVYFRNEEKLLKGEDWEAVYVTEIMPAKLAIDLEYIRDVSLRRDIVVIAKTFLALWGIKG